MKFKVGDKVRVVRISYLHSCLFTHAKKKYIGKVFTIASVSSYDVTYPYTFKEKNRFCWCDYELELVTFTKADLKDGMVVEFRDGYRRFVFNNKVMNHHTYIDLSVFDDNMIHPSCDDYSIDKVYTTSAHNLDTIYHPNCLTLIWERPKEEPAKKMTVEEIEKELGYKVEIVSDSENK